MTTLTVTGGGQVTLSEDVLKHLGIQPGGKIRLDLLPDGRAELKADQPKGSWQELRGMLKGKTNGARLSVEDINDAIADAGSAAALGSLTMTRLKAGLWRWANLVRTRPTASTLRRRLRSDVQPCRRHDHSITCLSGPLSEDQQQ